MSRVNILGSGLAGLSAAITLAKAGIESNLISRYSSERAQSVLAEGGINGALNTMGEDDDIINHFADTMRSATDIADKNAVRVLCENAPGILRFLDSIGVAFNKQNEKIVQRNFGGQEKKRTAFARSSTGKILMSALIDEARKYECRGLINRFPYHEFLKLLIKDGECRGLVVRNTFNYEEETFAGEVILAFGGMNGMFGDRTTGTVVNSGDALAKVFMQGVRLGNLEMIQYHPTTFGITGKRCLISEAARGEGGRLCINRRGQLWYFMEEKYPKYKNLMPRDVISREMYFVVKQQGSGTPVYLDMTGLESHIWKERLGDLRDEIIYYMGLDPAVDLIPVEPGIHYFMGGVDVDACHRTNIKNLYASGECCDQYHGANRLGGNSMLGAIYGGKVAAEQITKNRAYEGMADEEIIAGCEGATDGDRQSASLNLNKSLADTLSDAMGIVRTKMILDIGIERINKLLIEDVNDIERARLLLGLAIIKSAEFRKESRGAHYREDYPKRDESIAGMTVCEMSDDGIIVDYK